MAPHDEPLPECEERFRSINARLKSLQVSVDATNRTIRGENGTPGIATSLALMAQRLEAVEASLAAMDSAPQEVRLAIEAKLDALAAAVATRSSSSLDLSPSLVKALLAALGILGTALVIIAAVLGVDLGGAP